MIKSRAMIRHLIYSAPSSSEEISGSQLYELSDPSKPFNLRSMNSGSASFMSQILDSNYLNKWTKEPERRKFS